jgi:hypothetical protein
MPLAEQRSVFQLVDAESIGVALEASMLMQPTKSVSGIVGIGAADAFEQRMLPCERCNAVNCPMRRSA